MAPLLIKNYLTVFTWFIVVKNNISKPMHVHRIFVARSGRQATNTQVIF